MKILDAATTYVVVADRRIEGVYRRQIDALKRRDDLVTWPINWRQGPDVCLASEVVVRFPYTPAAIDIHMWLWHAWTGKRRD